MQQLKPQKWYFKITSSLLFLSISSAQAETLSLQAALEQLSQSGQWRVLDTDVNIAQKNLQQAKGVLGLQASISSEGQTTAVAGSSATGADLLGQPTFPSGQWAGNAGLSATGSLVVLPWSPSFEAVGNAERALQKAMLERRENQNLLKINLLERYSAVLASQKDLNVAQESLEVAQIQLENAQKQLEIGQIRRDRFLQIKTDWEEAKNKAFQAQSTLGIANVTLESLLNVSLKDKDLELLQYDPAQIMNTIMNFVNNLSADLSLESRYDLLKLNLNVKDALESLEFTKRERWLPSGVLSLQYGSHNGQSIAAPSISGSLNLKSGIASLQGNLSSQNNTSSNTGTTVSFSLGFDVLAPAADSKIELAQATLEQAQLSLQNARGMAMLDLQQKQADFNTVLGNFAVLQSNLETQKAKLEVQKARLGVGSATVLDVRSAEIAVENAQNTVRRNVFQLELAKLKWDQALGKDIKFL